MKAIKWPQLGPSTIYFPSLIVGMLLYSFIFKVNSKANRISPLTQAVCPEMLVVTVQSDVSGLICKGEPFQLSAIVRGGQPPYTYEWYDNMDLNGDPLGMDSILALPALTTTNYFVKVTSTCDGTIEESIADATIEVDTAGPGFKLVRFDCLPFDTRFEV